MEVTEVTVDPLVGATIVNETDIPESEIWNAVTKQAPEMAAISRWASSTRRAGGLFERDRYVTPEGIYEQMQMAQDAAENDDIVAGVIEATEAMAFSKMGFEAEDEDEEDIWNQIAANLDLDARLREMWRELFTVSQFYGVTWWGRDSYKVSGINPKTGVKRKKTFPKLTVPVSISLLDPLKVVPVGNLMFNQETLCYVADRGESNKIQEVLDNRASDEVIKTIMVGPYNPDRDERKRLGDLGVSTDKLFVLDSKYVWRHTATRAQYKRFADVRLKSVFEILDLKHQLREMDRAHLLGATNFIVLIKKGDKDHPGKPEEIAALQANVRTLARVPVIVGDHRLAIEIITPSVDKSLESSRYDMLDQKIASRLYQTFITNGNSTRDDSLKLARVVARGMESRRHMLRRALEKNVVKPTFEQNDEFTDMPTLNFHPTQIALDFDQALAAYLLDLRDRGDISRATILNQIDLDQDDEYRNRKREKDNGYDDVFETQVPFSSPNGQPFGGQTPGAPADNPNGGGGDPKAAGRTQGGNRSGGGAAPGSGQGQAPRNPRRKSD